MKALLQTFFLIGITARFNCAVYLRSNIDERQIAEYSESENDDDYNVRDADDRPSLRAIVSAPPLEGVLPWYADDYKELTQGIEILNTRGVSGKSSWLAMWGEKIFPLTLHKDRAILAGALRGNGRALILTNNEYVQPQTKGLNESVSTLLSNGISWLSKGKSDPKAATNDAAIQIDGLATENGVPVSTLANLVDVDIYLVNAHDPLSDDEISSILAYLENGGGLIVLVNTRKYSWDITGNDEDRIGQYINYPGNNLLKHLGAMAYGASPGSEFDVTPMIDEGVNMHYALKQIHESAASNFTWIGVKDLRYVVNKYTENEPLLEAMEKEAIDTWLSLDAAGDVPGRAYYSRMMTTMTRIMLEKAPEKLQPASTAGNFPGEIDSGAEIIQDEIVKIEAYHETNRLWRSTGLYAPPGAIITVTVPEGFLNSNYKIRIGCHRDRPYHHTEFRRNPEITNEFLIDTETTMTVANPFGGLIYVMVPKYLPATDSEVTVSGAVRAPYFKLGVDTDEEWNGKIMNYPAPWGELEVPNKIVLTFPTFPGLRNISSPESVLDIWDQMMSAAFDFSGFEMNGGAPKDQRIVMDIQISAGSAHSGYPVMYQGLHKWEKMTTYELMRDNGLHGSFHEIGHNIDGKQYGIPGRTGEVTCNWWSFAVYDQVFDGNKRLIPKPHLIHDYVFRGKPFEEMWMSTLAEQCYAFLWVHYGMQSYASLIKQYYKEKLIDGNASTEDKLSLWARLYAEEVQEDVCEFFDWWNWPLTNDTREYCKTFPKMSKDLMAEYNPPPSDPDNCIDGWYSVGDSCFFLSEDELTWDGALDYCSQIENSNLASCLSAEEVNWLQNYLPNERYFFGMREDEYDNSVVKNLDGSSPESPDTYQWLDGRPDPTDGRHCIMHSPDGWRDFQCSSIYKFVCKQGPTACGTPPDTCPDGWYGYKNKCYFFETEVKKTFDDAMMACQDMGAELVEINSQAEQNFVGSNAKTLRNSVYYKFWIGLKVEDGAVEHTWLSGDPVLHEDSWCEGEPDRSGLVYLDRSTCWNAVSPDSSKAVNGVGYICERDA